MSIKCDDDYVTLCLQFNLMETYPTADYFNDSKELRRLWVSTDLENISMQHEYHQQSLKLETI